MHISTNNADDYCEICFRVLEITKNRKNNDDWYTWYTYL